MTPTDLLRTRSPGDVDEHLADDGVLHRAVGGRGLVRCRCDRVLPCEMVSPTSVVPSMAASVWIHWEGSSPEPKLQEPDRR